MQSSADGTQNPVVSVFFRVFGSGEPPLIHVRRENMVAKVWLEPIALELAGGFLRAELNGILELVQEHRERLLRSWYEFFGH
jgi:hypothetical protein